MLRALAAIVVLLVAVYDALALIFILPSHQVVEACTVQRGVVWPTTLWHYCLASAALAPACAFCVLRLPFRRAFDAVDLHIARWKLNESELAAAMRSHDPALKKYGVTSGTPDWMFMVMGVCLALQATVLGVFAFWGYCQLFLMKAECRSADVAFRELSLWKFGLVTLFLQAAAGTIFMLGGALCLVSPFCFEVTLPGPKKDDYGTAGGSTGLSQSAPHQSPPQAAANLRRDEPPPVARQ